MERPMTEGDAITFIHARVCVRIYVYVNSMLPVALCAPPLIFQIPALALKLLGMFLHCSCVLSLSSPHASCATSSTAQPNVMTTRADFQT